jgi:hypothetical protein
MSDNTNDDVEYDYMPDPAHPPDDVCAKLVDEFGKDLEFFPEIRKFMFELYRSRWSKTLHEAYETAIWAYPITRRLLIDRERQSAAAMWFEIGKQKSSEQSN